MKTSTNFLNVPKQDQQNSILISKQFNFDRRQLKNTQLIVLVKTFTHFLSVKQQARSTIFFSKQFARH